MSSGFPFWGSGFLVSGVVPRVWSLGFGVWGLELGVWGWGFRIWGLGLRVLDFRLGFRILCCLCLDSGTVFRDSGFGSVFRDLRFGFRGDPNSSCRAKPKPSFFSLSSTSLAWGVGFWKPRIYPKVWKFARKSWEFARKFEFTRKFGNRGFAPDRPPLTKYPAPEGLRASVVLTKPPQPCLLIPTPPRPSTPHP